LVNGRGDGRGRGYLSVLTCWAKVLEGGGHPVRTYLYLPLLYWGIQYWHTPAMNFILALTPIPAHYADTGNGCSNGIIHILGQ